MSLPLLGLGEVEYKGAVRPVAGVLSEPGVGSRSVLQSKEGVGAAQRHAVHERLRRLGFDPVPPPERVGRPHRVLSLDAFDGRIEPFCDEVHSRSAHRGPPSPRHGTSGACWKAATGRTPQETRTGSLFVPLHPPGARGFEGHHPQNNSLISWLFHCQCRPLPSQKWDILIGGIAPISLKTKNHE